MKLPFMKFFQDDWIKDTRILSAEARGVWIDFICFVWEAEPRGILTNSLEEWSRIVGLPIEKLKEILNELKNSGVADITFGNDECNANVTVSCRRIVRDETSREKSKVRVSKYRERNANVTPAVTVQTVDGRHQTVDGRQNTTPLTPLPGGESFDALATFEKAWAFYPSGRRLGKKAAFRHFKTSVKNKEDLKHFAKAINNYVVHIEAKKIEEKFIQHCSTLFNNWQDWENYGNEKKELSAEEIKKLNKIKWEKDGRSPCCGHLIFTTDDGKSICGACEKPFQGPQVKSSD